MVGNHVAEVLRNSGQGSLPADLEAFIAERPGYDYHHHVKKATDQSRYVPAEIIERLCIIGTPEQCAERIETLSNLGVTHVNFYAQTDNYEQQMTIWSEQIIPRTRAAAGA
jgi:alkanesulfonate monooxygenase SsuD/methylene tetrahydromethanopterin reductase-like flavin-dependent oxidoreductase (luciferase family)